MSKIIEYGLNLMIMRYKLFSYKMISDSGFAPNPFHGFITLANCKPGIRRTKKKGDLIAGFTSSQLNGDNVGEERLVYLMRITSIKTYNQYWKDKKYQVKKPDILSKDKRIRMGDNIYEPTKKGLYQHKNCCHNDGDRKKDISGKNVLISKDFFYFGSKPLKIPSKIRPEIPTGVSLYGSITKNSELAYKFIEFVKKRKKIGLVHYPHNWNNNSKQFNCSKCE